MHLWRVRSATWALYPLTDVEEKLQVPPVDPQSPWRCGDVEFPIAERLFADAMRHHVATRRTYDKSCLVATSDAWNTTHGRIVDHVQPYLSPVKFDVPCLELGRHFCQSSIFFGPRPPNACPPLFTRIDKALSAMIGLQNVNTLGVQPLYCFIDATDSTRYMLALAISHLKSPFSAEFLLLDLPIPDLLEWNPAIDNDLIATVRRERLYGLDLPCLRTHIDISRLAHRLCMGRVAELVWFKIRYQHLCDWRFKILALDVVDLDEQVAAVEATQMAAQASQLLRASLARPQVGRGRGGGRGRGLKSSLVKQN